MGEDVYAAHAHDPVRPMCRMDVDSCPCMRGGSHILEPRARTPAPRPHSARTTPACQADALHVHRTHNKPTGRAPGRGRAGNDTIRGLRELRRAPQCPHAWLVGFACVMGSGFLCECISLWNATFWAHVRRTCMHICMHGCCVYGVVRMLTRPLAPVHYRSCATDDDRDPVPCRIPNSARSPGAQRPVHVANTARLDLARRFALMCHISARGPIKAVATLFVTTVCATALIPLESHELGYARDNISLRL